MHRIFTRATPESLAEEARCKAFYQLQILELKRTGASFEQRMAYYCDFYRAGMLPERVFSFLAVKAAEEILAQPEWDSLALAGTVSKISRLRDSGMPDMMAQAALICLDLYDDQEAGTHVRNELLSGEYWCSAGVIQNAYFGTAGGSEMN